MLKRLSLFLIVSFLAAQTFSLVHMAYHGFKKHEHNGRICEIYQHCEHAKYTEPGVLLSVHAPHYVYHTQWLPETQFITLAQYRVSYPRAPPSFS